MLVYRCASSSTQKVGQSSLARCANLTTAARQYRHTVPGFSSVVSLAVNDRGVVLCASRFHSRSWSRWISPRRCFATQGKDVGSDGAESSTSEDSGQTKKKGTSRKPDDEKTPQGSENIQFTWRSALFTTALCGSLWCYLEYMRSRKESDARAVTRHERLGTPKLGGPFTLVDVNGKTVTDKDLLGKYLLIYFGFSFCPDICPQEMEKQTLAVEMIDKSLGPLVTPVFITVDPARDTPEQVNLYVEDFHPRIIGLTGTPEQVKAVSRAYRVYYNEGIRNNDQDYLIDHSIIHYFVGKNGKFVDFFGKNMTAQEIADKMKNIILSDQEKIKERKSRHGVEGDGEE